MTILAKRINILKCVLNRKWISFARVRFSCYPRLPRPAPSKHPPTSRTCIHPQLRVRGFGLHFWWWTWFCSVCARVSRRGAQFWSAGFCTWGLCSTSRCCLWGWRTVCASPAHGRSKRVGMDSDDKLPSVIDIHNAQIQTKNYRHYLGWCVCTCVCVCVWECVYICVCECVCVCVWVHYLVHSASRVLLQPAKHRYDLLRFRQLLQAFINIGRIYGELLDNTLMPGCINTSFFVKSIGY